MCRVTCSLFLLLTLGVLADGWSTNIWPSQEHPMEGWRQIQECYTATVERCTAAKVAVPAPATNYMRGYETLTNLKSCLVVAVTNYVHPDNLDATSPFLATYYNGFTNKISTNIPPPPTWTVTGLLAVLQMPTNYFAFTPFLGVSGLGSHTNDVNEPRPHGVTNAFTIAGGTNLPASKTTWYDTDYGIIKITNLLAALTDTYQPNAVAITSLWHGAGKHYYSYDDAVAIATTNWSVRSFGSISSYFIGNYVQQYYGYRANAYNQQRKGFVSTPGSTSSHVAEFYVHASTNIVTGSVYTDTHTFNIFGESFTENKFVYWNSSATQTTSVVYSINEFGSTNLPLPWASEPPGNHRYWVGYVPDVRALVHWEFDFK